tara:strand:+ start:574 stop:774 length:201 start_codon:yes stop_codon:yes gene_type:complete
MYKITAVEFYNAKSESINKGADFISASQSKCGGYISRAYQVDTSSFEWVESRYNKATKQVLYFGSK